MTSYPHLFSPLAIGSLTVKNRLLMSAMSINFGVDQNGFVTDQLTAYFEARARGGAGLIVTGGIAPNVAGWVAPFAGKLSARREVPRHRLVTDAVHAAGGRVCMQILHAGRYAYHPLSVAPSPLKSPITPFKPRGLSARGVEAQIRTGRLEAAEVVWGTATGADEPPAGGRGTPTQRPAWCPDRLRLTAICTNMAPMGAKMLMASTPTMPKPPPSMSKGRPYRGCRF